MELHELAASCEKATGPDKGLDAVIYCALNPGVRVATAEDLARDSDIGRYDIMQGDWIGNTSRTAPAYTGSLDEAVKTIPKDFAWHTQWVGIETHAASASLWLPPARTKGWKIERFDCHEAAGAALALCAASLRARAAELIEMR